MKSVLFLCTGNSCRSQMAEGFARHLHADRVAAFSAGIETHGLNPHAVEVMAENGIDIRGHESKTLDALPDLGFDLVVTVCDHAAETCPILPGATRTLHRSFADPPRLARELTDPEEILDCYRRVRDEIHGFVLELPSHLEG